MASVKRGRVTTRVSICAAGLGLAVALAGCTPVTYGTGRSPTLDTAEDLANIFSIRERERPEVEYAPRPNLVRPPSSNLPPPAEPGATARNDWPNDPDQVRKQLRADQDRRVAGLDSGEAARVDPGFRLPPQTQANTVGTYDEQMADREAFRQLAGRSVSGRGPSVDTSGQPVRRYLTDPPVEYRQPDPNAPVTTAAAPDEKKKFSLRNLWPF